MSLSYPASRFVELQQSVTSHTHHPGHRGQVQHYDEKYPPDYEQATSNTDASSIRAPPSSANTTWSSGPFADPPTTPSYQVPTPTTAPLEHLRHASLSRRPLPAPSPGPRPQTIPHPPQTGGGLERWVYTHRLVAGGTPMQFMISVESSTGLPNPGRYTFRLTMKVNSIERPLGDSVERTLRVDPRQLEFVVFVFPGKTSLPAGCLWSLRVWLRVNGVDHRLFGEDELWIGKDPDFNSIGDASFARLKHQDVQEQVYNAFVGRALVSFTVRLVLEGGLGGRGVEGSARLGFVFGRHLGFQDDVLTEPLFFHSCVLLGCGYRWVRVQGNLYKYSLEYEAGGVGGGLFDDLRLKLDVDPRSVTFLIFTVPSNSVPAGASHKLRVWLRTLIPVSHGDPSAAYVLPFNDAYVYQRLWKTDDFKVGSNLQFENLGPKMVMGFSLGGPECIRVPVGRGYEGGFAGYGHGAGSSLGSMEEAKRAGYDF
ncbi:hypothetical protein D9611_002736 [Ephemerocybe angulata]|uniref:Uncharacterized protein n=1 Tax=Ephemerocybe angulata TaxID=980116 RepID=A0A8H5FE40_9AGAR|nr:hypothetical protein D9611_002736 [Tulosesus angulatus]